MLTIVQATVELSSKDADTILSKFLWYPNSIETTGTSRINIVKIQHSVNISGFELRGKT